MNSVSVKLTDGKVAKGETTDMLALSLSALLMGEEQQNLILDGKWQEASEQQDEILNKETDEKLGVAEERVKEDLKKDSSDGFKTKKYLKELLCGHLEIALPEEGSDDYDERYKAAIAKLPSATTKNYKAAVAEVMPRLIRVIAREMVILERVTSLLGIAMIAPQERAPRLIFLLQSIYGDSIKSRFYINNKDGSFIYRPIVAEVVELIVVAIAGADFANV